MGAGITCTVLIALLLVKWTQVETSQWLLTSTMSVMITWVFEPIKVSRSSSERLIFSGLRWGCVVALKTPSTLRSSAAMATFPLSDRALFILLSGGFVLGLYGRACENNILSFVTQVTLLAVALARVKCKVRVKKWQTLRALVRSSTGGVRVTQPSGEDEAVAAAVVSLREPQSGDDLVRTLSALDAYAMDVTTLQAMGAAMAVEALRNHSDDAVAARAEALLAKWERAASEVATPPELQLEGADRVRWHCRFAAPLGPLYTISSKIISSAFSEATMRLNPRRGAAERGRVSAP